MRAPAQGKVVDVSLKEPMRSHFDLTKGDVPHFKPAAAVSALLPVG